MGSNPGYLFLKSFLLLRKNLIYFFSPLTSEQLLKQSTSPIGMVAPTRKKIGQKMGRCHSAFVQLTELD